MKTIYLALLAFLCFSVHLIINPNIYSALCVGFSACFICFCEYLFYKSAEKITEQKKASFDKKFEYFQSQLETIKSEVASVKISNGFKRHR